MIDGSNGVMESKFKILISGLYVVFNFSYQGPVLDGWTGYFGSKMHTYTKQVIIAILTALYQLKRSFSIMYYELEKW